MTHLVALGRQALDTSHLWRGVSEAEVCETYVRDEGGLDVIKDRLHDSSHGLANCAVQARPHLRENCIQPAS